jgi:hypothetical protein
MDLLLSDLTSPARRRRRRRMPIAVAIGAGRRVVVA